MIAAIIYPQQEASLARPSDSCCSQPRALKGRSADQTEPRANPGFFCAYPVGVRSA
jgi:hypothetical protein